MTVSADSTEGAPLPPRRDAGSGGRREPLAWAVATLVPLVGLLGIAATVGWTDLVMYGRPPGTILWLALAFVGASGARLFRRAGVPSPAAAGMRRADLLVALAACVGVRVVWWFLAPSQPVSDFRQYENLAVQLASEGRFDGSALRIDAWFFPAYHDGPTAFRMPGYPLLLAAGYRLFGPNAWWGYVLNCLFACAATGGLWAVLRRHCPRLVGVVAVLFLAVYPDLVYATSLHGTDLAGAAAVALSAFGLVTAATSPRRGLWTFWAGVALAFAIHCRPFLYVVAPVWAWAIVRAAPGRTVRRAIATVPFALGLGLLLVPWAVRNAVTLGAPIWTHTCGWHYTTVMNNTDTLPEETGPEDCLPLEDAQDPACRALYGDDEVEMMRTGRRLALDWIRRNPSAFLRRGAGRLLDTFGDAGDALRWAGLESVSRDSDRIDRLGTETRRRARTAATVAYGILVGAALAAFVATIRFAPSALGAGGEGAVALALTASAVLGSVAFAAFVFEGQPRYHLPMIPLLVAATAVRIGMPRSLRVTKGTS
jgi:hypothetical protein